MNVNVGNTCNLKIPTIFVVIVSPDLLGRQVYTEAKPTKKRTFPVLNIILPGGTPMPAASQTNSQSTGQLMISRYEISEAFFQSAAGFINAEPESQVKKFTVHERAFLAGKESKSEWVMVNATSGSFKVLFQRHESYLSVCLSCPGKLTLVAKQLMWEAYRASGGNLQVNPRLKDTAAGFFASKKKSMRKKGVKEDVSFLDEAVAAGSDTKICISRAPGVDSVATYRTTTQARAQAQAQTRRQINKKSAFDGETNGTGGPTAGLSVLGN